MTVSNTGGASLANVGFQITGPAAASYRLALPIAERHLVGGGSCTAQVVFTPAATGAIAATLTVSSSTLGVTPVSVSLNGSGQLSGGLGGNPAQLAFPVVGVGQSSAALPVTINNTSSYAIGSLTLAVSAPFALAQNSCTSSLGGGDKLHRRGHLSAHRQRAGDRGVDGQLERHSHAGERGAVGNGLRFHGRGLRLKQPDCVRGTDRQLHDQDQSSSRSAREPLPTRAARFPRMRSACSTPPPQRSVRAPREV